MPNGIPIIQGQDPLGGLRQALTGFVGGTLQDVQNRQLAQQLGTLFPGQNLQGITDPRALQAAVTLGLQRQAQSAVSPDQFTLGPGQQRFTAAGQPIAAVKPPVIPPTGSFQQISDPVTGQQINALINPRTGNIIKKFGTVEEGLSAKDKVQEQ